MPLLRYFVFVGASLLALLFISDAYLPKLPVEDVTSAAADLPMIRIQSDRKWPERVVFDTRIPAISPAQTEAAVPASTTVADVSAKARVREAFAQLQPQLQPSEPKQLQPSVPKMPAPAVQRKRKIAKKHLAPPAVLAGSPALAPRTAPAQPGHSRRWSTARTPWPDTKPRCRHLVP